MALLAGLAIACIACAQRGTRHDSVESKNAIPAPRSFRNGAWLCDAPVEANGLDETIFATYGEQIKLTYSILDQISRNPLWDCKRVNSDGLKPLELYGDTARVTDGRNTGWLGTWSYLSYMNFHVIQPDASGGNTVSPLNEAWLCVQAANARNLGGDIDSIRGVGIQVTPSVLEQVGEKNKCAQVEFGDLRMTNISLKYGFGNHPPTLLVSDEHAGWVPSFMGVPHFFTNQTAILVSDEKHTGWMPASLYLDYMRHHAVRADRNRLSH
jgi:hypothetical protein